MKSSVQQVFTEKASFSVLEKNQSPQNEPKVNVWNYLGTLLLFVVLASLGFNMLFSERHSQEIENQEALVKITMKTVEQGFKKSAVLVFNNIINRPVYQQAMLEANGASKTRQAEIREKLYSDLLPVYDSMESFRLKQLHFHLHNNESFLRFHRPLKFGDNLTHVRPTVAYVNRTRQPISGFEEGRIFNGYRFVFPLTWQNQPAGSVETSLAMNTMLTEMSKELHQRVGFMIKKDVVEEKVFNAEKSNYVEVPFSEKFLYERRIENKQCCQFINTLLTGWNQKSSIDQWLNEDGIKTIFIQHEGDHLLSFMPVKNPITLATVGYIIVHKDYKDYQSMLYEYFGFWFVSLLIALLLTLLLYVLKRDELSLRAKNNRIVAQNELFEKTQELVHVGTWEFNLQTQKLYWSDEVFRILGFAPQSFAPSMERFLSYVHSLDRSLVENTYQQSVQQKENYQIEHRIVTTQGVERYVIEECEHVTNEMGEVIRSIGTIHDITSLRLNEKRLRSLKNRYKQLLDDLPTVVYRCQYDHEFEWHFINRAIKNLTGYSDVEILENVEQKTLFDFIHPADRHRVQLAFTKHNFQQGPLKLQYRIQHRNGRVFHIADLVRQVIVGDEGLVQLEGLMSDQTEQYHSMARLQKLIDQQANIVIVTDHEETKFANQSYYDFFGLPPAERQHQPKCIAKQFLQLADYFHLGRYNVDSHNWIDEILKRPADQRVVAMTNSLGHQRAFKLEISDFEDDYLVSFFDITDSQIEKQYWQYKASHDPLTGCHNRDFLEMNLGVFMKLVNREQLFAGLLILDIDFFKQVNDQYGHAEGDRILSELANLIFRNIRESDLFVRWGGEEFLLLMAVDSEASLEKIAQNLGRLVAENLRSPGGSITVSIGGSLIKDELDFQKAVARADAGLYYVKDQGRNGYLFVSEESAG